MFRLPRIQTEPRSRETSTKQWYQRRVRGSGEGTKKRVVFSMKVARTIKEFLSLRDAIQGRVGLVPTMGYLHNGHLSLVKNAKSNSDYVVASIFVNPTQFAPHEDLSAYPRDFENDSKLLSSAGVNLLFHPEPEEIYPGGWSSSSSSEGTYVDVGGIKAAEWDSRPGHFRGVATVVSKLFNIVRPQSAYFGQKDALQCIVIKKMVRDLNFPVDVVTCPTLREENGLAMSSRNTYLTLEEKQKAGVIYRAISKAHELYRNGEGILSSHELKRCVRDILSTEPLIKIDYVSIAQNSNGAEIERDIDARIGAVLSVAVLFNGQRRVTRLIDNILL
eukprot:TRINITY_DN1421_c0_g2_i6.p2 TRINITY_DN1421_c0_g2~~TRINITY_DN1421_c0_g2_i6.p2  ORF type:complete len:332 (+),score=47.29 TRINITY_DN1421_c0_g2_i6:760-1755(+)